MTVEGVKCCAAWVALFVLPDILHGGGPTAKPTSGETDEARAKKAADEAVRAGKVLGRAGHPPLADFLAQDALIAIRHDGEPLSLDHGGPARLIIPRLYAWKSAKWVRRIELLARDEAGFWESNGYHMRGDPSAEPFDARLHQQANRARSDRDTALAGQGFFQHTSNESQLA